MTNLSQAAVYRRVKALRSEVARADDGARAGEFPTVLVDAALQLRRLLPEGGKARPALERLFSSLDERPELCRHPGAAMGIVTYVQRLLREPIRTARDDARAAHALDRHAADLRFLKATRSQLANASSLASSRVPDFADLEAYKTWSAQQCEWFNPFGRNVMNAGLDLVQEQNPIFPSDNFLTHIASMAQTVHKGRLQMLASLAGMRAALKTGDAAVNRAAVRQRVAAISALAAESVALDKAVAVATANPKSA